MGLCDVGTAVPAWWEFGLLVFGPLVFIVLLVLSCKLYLGGAGYIRKILYALRWFTSS